MDDRSLVTALRSGDVRGLADVYDAHAGRLLSYAITVLGGRDAAADAVHDALLVARERIGQLREPDKLRPWLYAIVRNECLRQLRDRRRAAPLDAAGEVTDPDAPELDRDLRAEELRELVWSAAAALNEGEREVLELSVRHGLSGTELAAALGVSPNTAHALTSRSRAQLERSLGALLVARSGRDACPELAGMLAGWDGTLTPLLRKRLARHVDRCEICGETRKRRLSPVALLAGMPFVLAPPGLRDQLLRDVSMQQGLAERAGPWQDDGFPVPLDRRGPLGLRDPLGPRGPLGLRGRRTPWRWSAAAALLLALLVGAGLLLRPEAGTDRLAGAIEPPLPTALPAVVESGTGPAGSATTAAATPTTGPPPTTAQAATGLPTTTPATATTPTALPPPTTPPTTPPPTPTPTPTPSPTPTSTLTPQWTLLTPACPTTWRARLTVLVSGTTATAVQATAGQRAQPMTDQGRGVWTALVSLPTDTDLSWTATATTAQGTLVTAPQAIRYDCPPIG
ncbi:MAG TPA: sigma-70 family RNA polymerase sigma factor [Mycobacteriales bacterium]|nr:sigma-70 family RNA polymerase sigma factor [Mycobacteriales bacterium]